MWEILAYGVLKSGYEKAFTEWLVQKKQHFILKILFISNKMLNIESWYIGTHRHIALCSSIGARLNNSKITTETLLLDININQANSY